MDPSEKEKLRKLILWYIQFSEVKPQCVTVILDVKAGVTEFDHDMLAILKEVGHRTVVVANKVDKLNQKERSALMGDIKRELDKGKYPVELLACSAETKEGIDTLLKTLFQEADQAAPAKRAAV
jgi:GTP-binding protein EngB required for normal cell division